MFHTPSVSGIEFVKDLENSNVFLLAHAPKVCNRQESESVGLSPARRILETMANYSSFGMGGVSHPSQHYAVKLLEPSRVEKARVAVEQHYNWQRERYGKAFEEMGLGVYTGNGGFYHLAGITRGNE